MIDQYEITVDSRLCYPLVVTTWAFNRHEIQCTVRGDRPMCYR